MEHKYRNAYKMQSCDIVINLNLKNLMTKNLSECDQCPIFAEKSLNLSTIMITNPCLKNWQELLVANRQRLTPWKDLTTDILARMESVFRDVDSLENDIIPHAMLDSVSFVIDETLDQYQKMDYYLKLSIRFEVFHSLVGILIWQIFLSDSDDEKELLFLKRLAQSVIIKSIREPPLTIESWKFMTSFLPDRIIASYMELIEDVELQIMYLTGNTVYNYFDESCSKAEVDILLENAFKTLILEEEARQFSSRHGNGHSKTILQFVERWQENRQMKDVDRIKPFLVCLEAYWHGKIRLGSRQGVEKMYQKKRY